eukprot:6778643-Alexandrium_andersonii.AAC.1
MQIWAPEASREARCLRHQALKLEGPRLSLVPSRGMAHSARWAHSDRCLLGLHLGPTDLLWPDVPSAA